MKKIQLSIQDPCHQDWNGMQPDDRGRFCASCRKTVIDFAGMTDRQVAEFFKKPKDNICGRLHPDQMNRDILLPRKRIGWLRYFFGLTWPAFMLFLKSCGLRDSEVVGKLQKMERTDPAPPPVPGRINYVTPGTVSAEPLPEDTTVQGEIKSRKKAKVVPAIHAVSQVQVVQPDPVDSIAAPATCTQNGTEELQAYLGGISYTTTRIKVEPVAKKIDELPLDPANVRKLKIYPNPVTRNGLVTVDVIKPEQMPERLNIITASGQVIFSLQQQPDKSSTLFHFRLPANVVPGIYFLQMIIRDKRAVTEKIIVQ